MAPRREKIEVIGRMADLRRHFRPGTGTRQFFGVNKGAGRRVQAGRREKGEPDEEPDPRRDVRPDPGRLLYLRAGPPGLLPPLPRLPPGLRGAGPGGSRLPLLTRLAAKKVVHGREDAGLPALD